MIQCIWKLIFSPQWCVVRKFDAVLLKRFALSFHCLLSNLPGCSLHISCLYRGIISQYMFLNLHGNSIERTWNERSLFCFSQLISIVFSHKTNHLLYGPFWFTSPPALFSWPITLCFALPVVSCNYTKVYFELWIYYLLRNNFKGLVLPFKQFSSMFLAYFNMTTLSKFRQIL